MTPCVAAALAALGDDAGAMAADLAQLVACDTSFPPGAGYAAFADLMEAHLRPLGFATRRVEVPERLWQAPGSTGARVNLIAERGGGRPACSLYYQVDTVPPGDGWVRPPLRLTQEGARLYGRGTADMKGTIAATLAALRAADRHGVALRFDPVLLLCTDEEGGLYPGIRYLAEQGLVHGHLLSFNGGAAPRIWAGCFGSFDLLIRIEGRAAHSGDPTRGRARSWASRCARWCGTPGSGSRCRRCRTRPTSIRSGRRARSTSASTTCRRRRTRSSRCCIRPTPPGPRPAGTTRTSTSRWRSARARSWASWGKAAPASPRSPGP